MSGCQNHIRHFPSTGRVLIQLTETDQLKTLTKVNTWWLPLPVDPAPSIWGKTLLLGVFVGYIKKGFCYPIKKDFPEAYKKGLATAPLAHLKKRAGFTTVADQ